MVHQHLKQRLVGAMLVIAASCWIVPASAEMHSDTPNALWVYPDPAQPDPIANPTARQALVDNSAASHVTMLYVSVYRSSPNANGRYMYEDADMADLIARAHQKRIQVWAAYGAPDWPSLGCAPTSFPMQRIAELAAYNAMNYSTVFNVGGVNHSYSGKFDGVVLDIEPAGSQTPTQYTALLDQYRCLQTQANASGLGLSVAIRFYWKEILTYGGATKEVYKHVVDIISAKSPGKVVVMGYRDFAGPADCATDGMVCLDQDIIHYAAGAVTGDAILAGLETSNPASTGISDKETFYEEGPDRMNAVAQEVFSYFGPRNGLSGFAIHNYQNSYLTGSAAWPSTNPGFPEAGMYYASHVITPAGAPQTSTLVDPSTPAVITVTFPSVQVSGATYATPIDPVTVGHLPNGYVLNGALAFELTTTAGFTGPATVCFQLPSLGLAAFATLAVLHQNDDDSGFADVTVHGLPSDATTKTVCGRVSSFSPFVVARSTNVVAADQTPPTVAASITGPVGNNGWYRGDVTINWTVSDPESPILSSVGCNRVVVAEDTIGKTFTCSATSAGGRTSKSVTVKRDATPPIIAGMPATECTLSPNHKLVQVATVTAKDRISGMSAFNVSGTSNEPANAGEQDVVITGSGLDPRSIQLRADRLGTGTGRVYTLSAIATDVAGNTATATATCVVPHDGDGNNDR